MSDDLKVVSINKPAQNQDVLDSISEIFNHIRKNDTKDTKYLIVSYNEGLEYPINVDLFNFKTELEPIGLLKLIEHVLLTTNFTNNEDE